MINSYQHRKDYHSQGEESQLTLGEDPESNEGGRAESYDSDASTGYGRGGNGRGACYGDLPFAMPPLTTRDASYKVSKEKQYSWVERNGGVPKEEDQKKKKVLCSFPSDNV
jgi:hypothetical protein